MNNSTEIQPVVHTLRWRFLGLLVAVLAILGSFNLASMIMDRLPPVTFVERVPLVGEVPQGGILPVRIVVDRARLCRSVSSRWVVDSTLTKHSIATFTIGMSQALGRITDVIEITIPEAVAPGSAIYYVETDFYCNPLQSILNWPIRTRSPDVRFIVTPSEKMQRADWYTLEYRAKPRLDPSLYPFR